MVKSLWEAEFGMTEELVNEENASSNCKEVERSDIALQTETVQYMLFKRKAVSSYL
jgi:hypothetical protein